MSNKRKTRDQDGLYQRKDSPFWWVSYIDASGQRARRSTGTADRREAEAILSKWRVEAFKQHHWDEQPTRTFDELMLNYLKASGSRKRAPERDRYSMLHLFPEFTERDVAEISVADVKAYIARRQMASASVATINREVGLLSAAYNFARSEWGWDVLNPAAGCRMREPEGRVRWLSRVEARTLVQCAEQSVQSPALADFIRLALNTGCRKGELLGLEWSRVNLAEDIFYLEANHTKSGRRRSVPLNREARAAIVSRASYRSRHCPGSRWVFSHPDGSRLQCVKKSFKTACQKAGIEDFHIHDCRHTCAAWLVTAGTPLIEVRDLLGHATIEMTERYAHLAPDNVRAAVGRLDGDESRLSHVGNGTVVELKG